MPKAELLLDEVTTAYSVSDIPSSIKDPMKNLLSKVNALVGTINGIKCEVENVQRIRQRIKEFFDAGVLLHDLQIYTDL